MSLRLKTSVPLMDEVWTKLRARLARVQGPRLAEIERNWQPRPGDERNIELLMTICRELLEWGAPPETLQATLWSAGCTAAPNEPRLAELVTESRKYTSRTGNAPPTETGQIRLRQLMRLAYLDLPLVLMIVAYRAGQVASGHIEDPSDVFWDDTQQTYVPLLEMLGLWELRQKWLDVCLKHRNPEEYRRRDTRLGQSSQTRQLCYASIDRRLRRWTRGLQSVGGWAKRKPTPGAVMSDLHTGQALEELADQVTVDMTATTIAGCYQLLEIAHRLGTPIRGRFSDFIAAPQANGYRALHTSVINRSADAPAIRVEIRISTPEMQEVNHLGVVAAEFKNRSKHRALRCWWNQPDTENEIKATLHTQEVASIAPAGGRVYVFTPRGEVRLLRHGSTIIDFAYDLHAEIGHRCRQARVNGSPALLSYQLRNGDLVVLEQDFQARGPDPAWLHFVNASKTRNSIRRGLDAVYRTTHPGRAEINRQLETITKNDGFFIPAPRLEGHISVAAQHFGFGTPLSLYQAIANAGAPKSPQRAMSISVNRVVAFILQRELAPAILHFDGTPLLTASVSDQADVRFCSMCMPVPDKPILLARTTKAERFKTTLTIHRDDPRLDTDPTKAPRCLLDAREGKARLERSIKWGSGTSGRIRQDITIVTQDRGQLLGDLVKIVYADDRIDLTRVQAAADEDGHADIQLTVETPATNDLSPLVTQLMQRAGGKIWQQPSVHVPRVRNAVYSADNPFSTGNPVIDPSRFFGRERQLAQIRRFLEQKSAVPVITIHGQRRVGKTSMALLLWRYGLRDLPFVPAYVELEARARQPRPDLIYFDIARSIQHELASGPEAHALPLPSLSQFREEATTVLQDYLARVIPYILPRRLVIILDEFNILAHQESGLEVIRQLRSFIMSLNNAVILMPITHTSTLYQAHVDHPVSRLLSLGQQVEVSALDREAASRLIHESLTGPIKFDPEVETQITDRSGGNPYLIHRICHYLVEEARTNDTAHVSLRDLRRCIDEYIIPGGRDNFSFLEAETQKRARAFAKALACQIDQPHGWANLHAIASTLGFSTKTRATLISHLTRHHVIQQRQNGQEGAFVVDYYREYMRSVAG